VVIMLERAPALRMTLANTLQPNQYDVAVPKAHSCYRLLQFLAAHPRHSRHGHSHVAFVLRQLS
jgi:hypothetical protein